MGMYKIKIPVVESPNEIERKSPRLMRSWNYWIELREHIERVNKKLAASPLLARIVGKIVDLLVDVDKDYREEINNRISTYNDIKKIYNRQIAHRQESYYRLMKIDAEISDGPLYARCEYRLGRLWDLFAHEDEYIEGGFDSVFSEGMSELKDIIRNQ